MNPAAEQLVALSLSPWSLGLKRILRLGPEFCRPGASSEEPLHLIVEPRRGESVGLLAAWGFWLLDGAELGRTDAPGGQTIVSRRNSKLSVLITEPAASPSSAGGRAFGTLSMLCGEHTVLEGTIAPGSTGFLTDWRHGRRLPLVFPEGDGALYYNLEVSEAGFSRILPDRVIDEALIFSDAVLQADAG